MADTVYNHTLRLSHDLKQLRMDCYALLSAIDQSGGSHPTHQHRLADITVRGERLFLAARSQLEELTLDAREKAASN